MGLYGYVDPHFMVALRPSMNVTPQLWIWVFSNEIYSNPTGR